jgi:ABC-type xylose transport system permease subunit
MLSKQIVEKIQANIKTYTMIMALALIWLLFGFSRALPTLLPACAQDVRDCSTTSI